MRYTPRRELDTRAGRLQARLAQAGLDGALIVHTADLFYFAGTIQQAHLFVPVEGAQLLMARKSFERARQESALDCVVPLSSLRQLPGLLAEHGYTGLRRLGLELDVMPVNVFQGYQRLLPGVELLDVSTAIRELRAVKSAYEIERMREAGRLMARVCQAVPSFLRTGMTELEFAAEVEALARRLGHQGLIWTRHWNQRVYFGTVVAGDSGAVVSYFDGPLSGTGLSPAMPTSASVRRIGRGEPVVLDYVFACDGYLVDQTRVFSIGPLPAKLVAAYEAMRQVEAAVVEAARPGVLCSDLYDLAVETATRLGYADPFMGCGEGKVSFVGHGVGLELDELPVLARSYKVPLEAGMTFALEPKAIFPAEGAVGVENTWVVSDTGLLPLTQLGPDLTGLPNLSGLGRFGRERNG
jgi:Xaa-Pro aminopeptidase